MFDSNSNKGRVSSAGTGVCLCDFITLHANSERGWPWRQNGEKEGDGAKAGTCAGKRGERKREGKGEGWCDDRAAGAVFVHESAGKLITRQPLTPLKC